MTIRWEVKFTKHAHKQLSKLPKKERDKLNFLVRDLEFLGPVQPQWPNYSKLSDGSYHCHLSYKWVACWRAEKGVLTIYIYYASSREGAPYA